MAETTDLTVKTTNGKMARRTPFEMFETLQDEMERFWSQPWSWPIRRPMRRMLPTMTAWAPQMDVFEKGDKLVVKAELPGIKKEDITLTLEGGTLEIRGERKAETEVKEEAYYRMERTYGSFCRRMPLPFEVNPDEVQATFTEGVLEISMPRPSEEKPKAQTIKVT